MFQEIPERFIWPVCHFCYCFISHLFATLNSPCLRSLIILFETLINNDVSKSILVGVLWALRQNWRYKYSWFTYLALVHSGNSGELIADPVFVESVTRVIYFAVLLLSITLLCCILRVLQEVVLEKMWGRFSWTLLFCLQTHKDTKILLKMLSKQRLVL